MKKTLRSLLMVACIGTGISYGQVNVGSTTPPDASVALQVSGSNLGFMPPKVSLTATNEFGLSGDTKTPGILVYNTNNALTANFGYPSFGSGLYMWTGAGWLWQGPRPSIIFSSPASGTIATGTVDIPLKVTGKSGAIGRPEILPTATDGAIVAARNGNYQYSLDGYISQAAGAGGSITIEVDKNGAYSTEFQLPVVSATNGINVYHFSNQIGLNAGDKLTFKVKSNATGQPVAYVFTPNITINVLSLSE